jgi:hypothetical protein
VLEAMQSARGSAYSTSQNSAVYVENAGLARIIDRDVYGANERLAAQFTPTGMTVAGLLPRWEKILGIVSNPATPEATRRARVAQTWARIGQTNDDQPIRDALSAALGPVFVGIVYASGANVLEWWPGNFGLGGITAFSTPLVTLTTSTGPAPQTAWYGQSITIANAVNASNNGTFTIVAGSPPSTVQWNNAAAVSPDAGSGAGIQWSITNAVPWSSNVAHIQIQVQVPGGWSESQFQAAIGNVFPVLDSIMPAWATWDWWRVDSVHGTKGFYLDSPHNLDNDIFDV